MAKITFILGLSGSGKSYILNELVAKENVYPIDEGFTPFTGELFCKQYLRVLEEVRKGNSCGIIEINLCNKQVRDLVLHMLNLDVPEAEIKWICIKKDIDQANKNVILRDKKLKKGNTQGLIKMNNDYSDIYTYPEGAEIIEMYKLNN